MQCLPCPVVSFPYSCRCCKGGFTIHTKESWLKTHLGLFRPCKAEGGSSAKLRLKPYPSASTLDDFFDDGETNARSFNFISSFQPLEDAPNLIVELRCNTGTVVCDRKLVVFAPISNTHPDAGITALCVLNGVRSEER